MIWERLNDHETVDEARHSSNTSRLTALEVAMADLKGYIRGRTAAIAVVLSVAIPLITWFVNALLSPHGSPKL